MLFLSPDLSSQNLSLPVNIQAALLTKVIKFIPKLSDKHQIKILVIYNNKTRLFKEEMISELDAKKMEVKAILPSELEQNIKGFDVAYFMPGIQDENGVCKSHKVLTMTGVSKYVEEGSLSIAFGLQNDKPKIYINLTSVKEEEQSLSSDLLRIAKVFK